jgi:hypothetical protein
MQATSLSIIRPSNERVMVHHPQLAPPGVLAFTISPKLTEIFQCFACDRPDPLKTETATGRLKSELRSPK